MLVVYRSFVLFKHCWASIPETSGIYPQEFRFRTPEGEEFTWVHMKAELAYVAVYV